MGNYEGLATIYDRMMQGVDYEAWADYVLAAAARAGVNPQTGLDLACGTGNTTIPLARRQVAMTGVDLAWAMLAIAKEKTEELGLSITYETKNMLHLNLNQIFDMVVSFQDGINYLTGEGDFYRLAKEVAKVLRPGGVFIFDLNLVDQYDASATTVVDLDDIYLVYENEYDEERGIWRVEVTGFVAENGLYRRFNEVHEEKKHEIEEVQRALADSGFSLFALWGIFTTEAPKRGDKRLLIVAKKEIK